jgi:hypothetical protein
MSKDEQNPVGRPSLYTPELAESICVWISGGKSLHSFCRQPDTPDISTITRWVVKHDEFRAQYVHAREAGGYAHADSIADVVERLDDGELEPNTAKAMMDGLKWTAERMSPRAHMPQSLVNHQSPDGTMTPKPAEPISPELVKALAKKLTG